MKFWIPVNVPNFIKCSHYSYQILCFLKQTWIKICIQSKIWCCCVCTLVFRRCGYGLPGMESCLPPFLLLFYNCREEINFLEQYNLCRYSSVRVSAPLAEERQCSYLWKLCCSISSARLVKSGDNFLSAVSCITTLLLWITDSLIPDMHPKACMRLCAIFFLHTSLKLNVHCICLHFFCTITKATAPWELGRVKV